MAWHRLLSGFLANGQLPEVSGLAANEKGDKTEENPGKPQLGDSLIKAARPGIASNEVPYYQMTTVGSHRTLVWRMKERMGASISLILLYARTHVKSFFHM